MCGRYASSASQELLEDLYEVDDFDGMPPASWNIAPTDQVPAVIERPGPDGPRRKLVALTWGLVPSWSKDARGGARLINARLETVAAKPAFRKAFAARRCLLPADGYYEWEDTGERERGKPVKQPYFIHRVDDEPLAFAGLWEAWKPKGAEDDEVLRSTTIVTTDANATMSVIHDRMPVILPPSKWAEWLDPANEDVDSLAGLLVPAPPQLLTMHPVSTDVGNVRNRGAYLVDAIPESQVVGSGPEAR